MAVEKVALLFPGQGAQTVGMGKQLIEASPEAAETYRRAGEVLGYDLLGLCVNGPSEKLDSTEFSQPALYVTSLAALEVCKQANPELTESGTACAGLSLGEYTALVYAGVLSFEDGLRVVQIRGQAMQAAADASPSGMVSVLGLELDQVQQVCVEAKCDGGTLQLANLLCPGNIVISGDEVSCQQAAAVAERLGAMRTIPLAVAGAFHTPLMQPAVEKLAAALATVTLNKPRVPVVSNVDAAPHEDPEEIRKLLVDQVVSPVRWEDSIRYLIGQGYGKFHEIGPGRVLKGLLRRIDRKTACDNVAC